MSQPLSKCSGASSADGGYLWATQTPAMLACTFTTTASAEGQTLATNGNRETPQSQRGR